MSQSPAGKPTPCLTPRKGDTWYYPSELANDLKDVDIPEDTKAELIATAWEAMRSVIPFSTSWERYLAIPRLYIIFYVAEFHGKTIDVLAGDNILGYSVSSLVGIVFQGTSICEDMAREFRCMLLIVAEKASDRRNGEFFRRFANSLAQSPAQYFRMRDRDGLLRFSLMAALACNDVFDEVFSQEQLEILSEIILTMYDAVAFYKHRSEGEICNTFAYMPADLRAEAFRRCREVYWALDVAWARRPSLMFVPNFLRMFGGSVYMMMRRYRFVEDGLTIGMPETEEISSQARSNVKLWYRVDANKMKDVSEESFQRYKEVLDRREELLFPGLDTILETADERRCETCLYPDSYGAEAPIHCFGGVQLCDKCGGEWCDFLESFPDRAAKAFPELVGIYNEGITSKEVVE
ncbi:Aba 3 protein [Mycena venus]|uniref:Aba 3 protein n=1 Tax=Mycena venus TaxID=2733690 RepID=A0A8H6XMQ1_9AGAR|nr:Aba 3 protein [Mycena venus]